MKGTSQDREDNQATGGGGGYGEKAMVGRERGRKGGREEGKEGRGKTGREGQGRAGGGMKGREQ